MNEAIGAAESAFVVEAGALKETPLGAMLIRCLTQLSLSNLLRSVHRDPERIERVAIASAGADGRPMLLVGGTFAAAHEADAGTPGVPVGRRGHLLTQGTERAGIWDDRLLIFGEREEDIEAALARLEGGLDAPPPLPADEAYGDVYGTLQGDWLRSLLPSAWGERAMGALARATIHVDAGDDLLIVADAYGPAPASSDLGVSLGAGLALLRSRAASVGDEHLLRLLEESRVVPAPGGFKLEVALPLALIEQQLSECARPAQTAP